MRRRGCCYLRAWRRGSRAAAETTAAAAAGPRRVVSPQRIAEMQIIRVRRRRPPRSRFGKAAQHQKRPREIGAVFLVEESGNTERAMNTEAWRRILNRAKPVSCFEKAEKRYSRTWATE